MSDEGAPRISIVLVGRNDDYGSRFADRFLAAVAANRALLHAHGIPHEYVFVDWAYDPERELFARILKREFPWWHRLVAVDRRFQERKKTNPRLEFMEFWAKNVGIRRSSAPFVLTTNSDVFLSRGIVSWLANAELARDRCYRAVRVDIKLDVTCQALTHEILEAPEAASVVNLVTPPYYTNASGDFLLCSRELWDRCGGFNERITHAKVHLDGNFCFNAVEQHRTRIDCIGKVWHLEHKKSLNLSQHLYGKNNELAPYGPDWDWRQTYVNDPAWGLADRPIRLAEDGVAFIDWDGK
jgi:hypothetical protein